MSLWVRLAAVLCLLASPGLAQVVTPRAGEHADFTRVALTVPAGSGWSLSADGATHRLTLDAPTFRFDLAQLFQRIPRTRLSEATAQGPVLTLALACDCPITAWEERPGLIVLDIADPDPEAPATEIPVASPPPPPPLPPRRRVAADIDPITAARVAGTQLARAMPAITAAAQPPVTEDPRLATLAEDLGRAMAQALGDGILDAS